MPTLRSMIEELDNKYQDKKVREMLLGNEKYSHKQKFPKAVNLPYFNTDCCILSFLSNSLL